MGAGLAAGLGEQLIERAVGKPLYQEVRLMLNLLLRPDAVAVLEAAAVQRLERTLASGRTRTQEQLAMEIATKSAELNTIRLLRPLPVGPGALPVTPSPAPVGNQPLP